MTIQTIPNTPQVQVVEFRPDFSAMCSVGHAAFFGRLDIMYHPDDCLLEFESFHRWLREDVANRQLTIEDLCRLVFDVLHEALGDICLSVTVNAQTTVHAPVRATIFSQGENLT